MKKPLLPTLIVLLGPILAIFSLPVAGQAPDILFSTPQRIEQAASGIPEVWFNDEGHMVIVERAYIGSINEPGRETLSLDITVWTNGANLSGKQTRGPIVVPDALYLRPAVSRDASQLAFVDETRRNLVILRTSDPAQRKEIILTPTKSRKSFLVRQLSFVGPADRALAVLFDDGELQIYKADGSELELLDYTWLDVKKLDPSLVTLRMWGSEEFVYVASFLDRKLIRTPLQANGNFKKQTPTEPEIQTTELSDTAFAVNKKGTAIFSSSNVQLKKWTTDLSEPSILKEAIADLRKIAIGPDEDFFMIAGDDLTYCEKDSNDCSPVKVGDSDPSFGAVGAFATDSRQVAYSLNRGIWYTERGPAEPGATTTPPSWSVKAETFLKEYTSWIVAGISLILVGGSLLNSYKVRHGRWPWSRAMELAAGVFAGDSDEYLTVKLPPLEVPERLTQACVAGDCVLFIGAGVSAGSGYPIWKEFVLDLVGWATEKQYIDQYTAAAYREETIAGNGNLIADNIYSKVEERGQLQSMYEFLRSRFESSAKGSTTIISKHFSNRREPNHVHELLKRIPVSAVLTTNFDELLEEAYLDRERPAYTYRDTDAVLTCITKKEFFILKLYGDLKNQESLLVAPAQFEEAIGNNRPFSEAMETLFRSRTILFVGASLEGIETYLKTVSLARSAGQNNHFALVHVTDDTWRARADFLQRRYGITVLPFATRGTFHEVETFLEALGKEVDERGGSIQPSETELARLQSITLRNIGPFDEQKIEFDSQWNLLLGDNGVGKSTVLRAIAVALCGEKATKFAGRLVKMQSENGDSSAPYNVGTITLVTNRNISYITDILVAHGTEDYSVRSDTAKPMESEGWLALGFPPLRSIGWSVIKGPSTDAPNRERPVAELDLMPLLTGEPDPRLDKLKEWIVTLDYERTKRELELADSGAKYKRLIDKVFEFVNAMIAPTRVEYKGVDKNKRILIETADGPIPLEAVSQGMASLIGWTGVLMQRMYEIYEKDENPLERYALVLIDEIDAHMHPHWQQQLIPRLRNFFPKAQFIISTHSPLIVAGFSPNEITRFARNADGKVETKRIAPDMAVGYLDQVLTSELFGLSSTLPVKTQETFEEFQKLQAKTDKTPEDLVRYENLLREIQYIPGLSGSYEDTHQDSWETAQLMKKLAMRVNELAPGEGDLLFSRGETLLEKIEGGRKE